MKKRKTTSSLITRNGHRVNPMTLEPGGYNMKLEFSDGSVEYTRNTKSPYHYIITTVTNILMKGCVNLSKATVSGTGELVYENGKFTKKFSFSGN